MLRNNIWIAAAALALQVPLAGQVSAYKEKVLYSFCAQANCADGQAPGGDLVKDPRGNLFGTTGAGGDEQGHGVAFELVHKGNAWRYKRLYAFCQQEFCADGASPRGHLVLDVNGNLYGVTNGGNQEDTIFRLSHENHRWSLQSLLSFCPTGQIAPTAPFHPEG